MQRGAVIAKRSPGPFHCVACRTYVTGTPSGHCPRCGWVPPIAPELPAAPQRTRVWWLVLVACAALLAWLVQK